MTHRDRIKRTALFRGGKAFTIADMARELALCPNHTKHTIWRMLDLGELIKNADGIYRRAPPRSWIYRATLRDYHGLRRAYEKHREEHAA